MPLTGPIPPSSLLQIFSSFIPGLRLVDGGDLAEMAKLTFSTASGLTATASGTQLLSTLMPATWNEVDTVATIADACILPLAVPGSFVAVNNAGGAALQMFGQVSDPANASSAGDTIVPHGSSTPAATATGVAQAANSVGFYICFKAGVWKQALWT